MNRQFFQGWSLDDRVVSDIDYKVTSRKISKPSCLPACARTHSIIRAKQLNALTDQWKLTLNIAELPDDRYPSISDLKDRARCRIPFFAWEYLDSATGAETAMYRNEAAFSQITMVPRFMKGEIAPDISTKLFGKEYSAPVGIAPIGYTSMMWPGAEQILARTAASKNIPYCLSTVASDTPERCGPVTDGNGWFQLYPPRSEDIRSDLVKRAKESGFSTLVVTADVPTPSMRERQRRSGISISPKITPRMISRIMARPTWLIETIKNGRPGFSIMEKYADGKSLPEVAKFVGSQLFEVLDWEYFKRVREQWDGPLVLKGILSVDDAKSAIKEGADAVWVSNHGGRQFESAPAPIDVLPEIAKAIGKSGSVIFDSGVRSGGDVLKAIAFGADFVFLGRPFVYGVSALAEKGGDHVYEILRCDLINNMHQLGIESLDEMSGVTLKRCQG